MSDQDRVLFRRIVLPAINSKDGETASEFFVTEEHSGYVAWYSSFDVAQFPLKFSPGKTVAARSVAIEWLVTNGTLENAAKINAEKKAK